MEIVVGEDRVAELRSEEMEQRLRCNGLASQIGVEEIEKLIAVVGLWNGWRQGDSCRRTWWHVR